MPNERDFEAQEAGEEWRNDLRERSLGTCHVQEWEHIWIGVMLRRVNPETRLYRFRSLSGWERLIDQQISPNDAEGPHYEIYDFFHATDSPWKILRRTKGDYGIGCIVTLDQDIEYARGRQSKRVAEENRLRRLAGRKLLAIEGKTDHFKSSRGRHHTLFSDGSTL
jgi:hypothetical protein